MLPCMLPDKDNRRPPHSSFPIFGFKERPQYLYASSDVHIDRGAKEPYLHFGDSFCGPADEYKTRIVGNAHDDTSVINRRFGGY